MKQPTENTFDPAIDRIIEDDILKDEIPFLYTRILQAIENGDEADLPLLPPLFSRFAIASIVIFLSFNLLLLLHAPDCSSLPESAKNANVQQEDPYAKGIDYDNITDILLNQ